MICKRKVTDSSGIDDLDRIREEKIGKTFPARTLHISHS